MNKRRTEFLFISYSRHDREFVDALIRDLTRANIPVWIDHQGLTVGNPSWDTAIREAIRDAFAILLVASPESRESRFVRDELYIADTYQKQIYPVWCSGDEWTESVPIGLIGTQYIDARGFRYETAVLQVIQTIETRQSRSSRKRRSPTKAVASRVDFIHRNPYKGLNAFQSTDIEDFCGRDHLILQLVELVLDAQQKAERFLAVVGPSGSGKSSLVLAGLIPALKNGAIPGSDHWIYLDPVLPGQHPIEELAIVFARHLNTSIGAVYDDFQSNIRGLHLRAKQLTSTRASLMMLFIDQFEEIFTLTRDKSERDQFIDLLTVAATEPEGLLFPIITLRADFFDRPMNYFDFGQLLQSHMKAVLPMTLPELREVIEKPARLPEVQLQFEDSLVGDLLFEVRGETGALPLLEFTLDQLFRLRVGNMLTVQAYNKIGGVRGALTTHAEITYATLPSQTHKDLTRVLFLRLVEVGENEQEATRKRTPLSELDMVDPKFTQILSDVSRIFVAARLLTSGERNGVATIEVSHEALIREWQRFSTWLREVRDDIRLQQIINSDAKVWVRQEKNLDNLYYGAKLREARHWAERYPPNQDEMEFIKAAILLESEEFQKSYLRDMLFATSALLPSTSDSTDVLRSILTTILETLNAEIAIVVSRDISNVFRNKAVVTYAKAPFDLEVFLGSILPVIYDVVGQRLESIRIVIIEDIQQEISLQPYLSTVYIPGSLIIADIDDEQMFQYLLLIMHSGGGALTQMHFRIVSSVLDQLSVLIRNIDQYTSLRVDAAKRLDKLRDDIILALPHELRTTFNVILGFSDMIISDAETMESAQVVEFSRHINGAAMRLYRIIENFLMYANTGLLLTSPKDLTAIRRCVTENPQLVIEKAIVDKVEHLIDRRQDVILQSDTKVAIQIAEVHLRKVIEELVDNALKFSDPGSKVEVKTSVTEHYYKIVITNYGRSMTEEQIAYIGAYMQVDRRFYEQQGNVLGLVIVKRLTEIYAGKMTIIGEPEKGTSVTVFLPLASSTLPQD